MIWHLYGILPRECNPPPGKMNSGAAFVWMDRYLDTMCEGPRWLTPEAWSGWRELQLAAPASAGD